MHELPVINSILSVVLKHAEKNKVKKVVTVHLQVGELSDLEEKWMQHYFDYLSANTLAQGAILKIEKIPLQLQCKACDIIFKPASHDRSSTQTQKDTRTGCPECGGDNLIIVSGREYYISNMEVL